MYWVSVDDPWSLEIDDSVMLCLDWPATINWVSETIDDATQGGFINRDLHDFLGSLDQITFTNGSVFAEDNDTYRIGF